MAEERDPKLSQRYRELGREEPSRELDQTILAAAHRSADKPHAPLVTPAGRHRWYFAFGAAAVLVLAVAVTVHVERQRPDAETMTPAPVSPPQHEPVAKVQTLPREKAAESEARRPAAPAPLPKAERPAKAESRQSRPDQSTARMEDAQPAYAPPAAPPAAEVPASPQARLEESRGRMEASADHQPRAEAQIARVESPERWLERIVELRKEGRHEEADRALAEFRRRNPDYRISEEMLKKVER